MYLYTILFIFELANKQNSQRLFFSFFAFSAGVLCSVSFRFVVLFVCVLVSVQFGSVVFCSVLFRCLLLLSQQTRHRAFRSYIFRET